MRELSLSFSVNLMECMITLRIPDVVLSE